MSVIPELRDLIAATPLADTHEHIIEEEDRLVPPGESFLFPSDDIFYLLAHYVANDLVSAGMTGQDLQLVLSPDPDLGKKWAILEPYWQKVKLTGYGLALRITLRELYQEEDITSSNLETLNGRYRERVRPGFYREILRDAAGIDHCQVNSLQRIFCETSYPDLLRQDISLMPLSTPPDVGGMARETGVEAATVEGWYEVIDRVFEKYGPKAVAVKSQAAYGRPLNYEDVPKETAAPLFERHARGEELARPEMKALQDHLFRRCVSVATDYGLVVKLHTGYYAGNNYMPLDRVGGNPADLCALLRDFPRTTFDIFHIGYPYQQEMIAVAKHFTNACIDMCWAWIIDPNACVRFLQDFLVTVPWHKLHVFGGDFFPVENVVGHAAVARRGIGLALSRLVEDGWLTLDQALALVPELMHRNAGRNFGLESRPGTAAQSAGSASPSGLQS